MKEIKSTKKNIKFYNSFTGDTFTEECDVVFEGKGNFETVIIVRYGDKFQDFFYDEGIDAFMPLTDIEDEVEPSEEWIDLDTRHGQFERSSLECPEWFTLSNLCEDLD